MNNHKEGGTIVGETAINSETEQTAAVNSDPTDVTTKEIPVGTVLGDKYQIIEPLSIGVEEADLYVCKYDEKKYTAKVYKKQLSIKPEIISTLESINSPYTASLLYVGQYNGLTFEVFPYYENGSLKGKTLTFDELKNAVIPCISEAIHTLHKNNIIDIDLSPSNIVLSDDNTGAAIFDFGISSVIGHKNADLTDKTDTTLEYSAPETFENIFLEESDYYSFGIALYELYCGYTPCTTVQPLLFPKDMPKALQELISALTYFDIKNRQNKENPNRRWTYTEVQNWCNGKEQAVPVKTEKSMPAYTFSDHEYKDILSLITAFANNRDDGKKQLYNGSMSAFFGTFSPEIAEYCIDAENETADTSEKDDIIFRSLLYKIYLELNGFYWIGKSYESLPALGRDMLEKLSKNDESDYEYWDSILDKKLLSKYLTTIRLKNTELSTEAAASIEEAAFTLEEAVTELETAHISSTNKRSTIIDYYTMAYLLSDKKLFNIGNEKLRDISDLNEHMKKLLASSYEEFEDFCHTLIDYDDNLDVRFEAWLIALGKRKELDTWKKGLVN